ncbi:MAG: hypothetical protein ACK5L5_04595 [Bacteroidales bacterium]
MAKNQILEEGQVYAVPLSDGSYTIAQLINHHPLGKKLSVDTFAFFNYKFDSLSELECKLEQLSLNKPFSIATANGDPDDYDWQLLGLRTIAIDQGYKRNVSNLGNYNKSSTDPSIFLEPYFGLFPWDGYFKDDYLDEDILSEAEIRDDVKYMRDYTTEELKEILPSNSPKLIQRLKEEEE